MGQCRLEPRWSLESIWRGCTPLWRSTGDQSVKNKIAWQSSRPSTLSGGPPTLNGKRCEIGCFIAEEKHDGERRGAEQGAVEDLCRSSPRKRNTWKATKSKLGRGEEKCCCAPACSAAPCGIAVGMQEASTRGSQYRPTDRKLVIAREKAPALLVALRLRCWVLRLNLRVPLVGFEA